EEIEQIVEIQLRGLQKTVQDRGIRLTWTPEAKRYLAERGYDPTFGARPLKRLVQKEVSDELAEQILAGHLLAGDSAVLDKAPDGEGLTVQKAGVKEKAEKVSA